MQLTTRRSTAGIVSLLALLVACSGEGSGVSDHEGTATLEIKKVPSDARCLRLTAAGRRSEVRDFELSPGASTVLQVHRLPTGAVSFSAEAFDAICRRVGTGAVPGWVSDTVVATIVANPPAKVALTMQRNGRGTVEVDWEEEPPLKFATFNASLNRNTERQLIADLGDPVSTQPRAVAEVIQRTNPDVILINEFDYDAGGTAAELFRENFLEVSQNGADPVYFPYVFVAPSNTGVASGFDLNDNGHVVTTPGAAGYGDDALGFGAFPGQYGMVVYSKLPIDEGAVRTFQSFLWRDMPGALLPDDSKTPGPGDFYSDDELAVFRLSSKSHWDIPVLVGDRDIHVLASHPTPPVFDGPEDRNGRRNFDEIRFWADYVTPGAGAYIYDDAGALGGLAEGASFVLLGDMNSDPLDGDSVPGAAQLLLDNPRFNTRLTPESPGAVEQAALQGSANASHRSNPKFDTADFADTAPGNLRADYVLPSSDFTMKSAGVFWPEASDPLFRLVGVFPFPTSDHRLVFVTVELGR